VFYCIHIQAILSHCKSSDFAQKKTTLFSHPTDILLSLACIFFVPEIKKHQTIKTIKHFSVLILFIILLTQNTLAMEKKTVQKTTVLCISINSTLKSMMTDTGNLPDELVAKATELQLEIAGPQIWVYEGSDGNPNTKFELTIAIPVSKTFGDPGKFRFAEFPEFKCISEIHKGAYAKLGETYQKLMPAIMQQGLSFTGTTREIYKVADFENQENCITEIQIQIK
jgi:effector-binding domain-containing protein